jgi:hypothetical protein
VKTAYLTGDKVTGLATTAQAFATYSLVPYLGIMFCPGAVIVGSVGLVRSYRPGCGQGVRRVCRNSIIVGSSVLLVQILLWWLLYKVPLWAQGLH